MAHAYGYTIGYTMGLVLPCCSWQHLAEYRQNTAELGLLGRTITFRKTPGIPVVFLSRTQRVGQTVGHFGYATGEVSV